MCTKKKFVILRNSFAVLILVVCSCLSVSAQEQKSASENHLGLKLGVKGGLNLSNLYVNDVQDEKMKTGFNLGLFAKIPVTHGFSVQPELLYSSKGSRITYDNLIGSGEYRFNLNYVEVPLLGVINLARNFNLHAGGYVSYLTSANVKRINNNGTNNEVASFNEDNFNRVDYGLIGGLGVDVENFTIGARYNYGLREVGKSGNVATQALSDSKNSVISLYVGFGF